MHRLAKQGQLMNVLEVENSDLTWKSIMYNLPKGLLSFAVRASTDSLPTPDDVGQIAK